MTLRPGIFVAGASGVTAPQDARLALAGMLSGVGVLSGGAVTGSSSGPNMKYVIAAGTFATARAAASDGLFAFANDAPLTIDSAAPAPSSGTRWDLVWVRHQNSIEGGGDATSLPLSGVTVGTSGSSPTKPYGSVPTGALVLAESHVGTSIANASLATITQVAAAAAARGGILPVTSAYPSTPRVGDYVDDAAIGLLRWNGTAWKPPNGLQLTDSGSASITPSGGNTPTSLAVTFNKTFPTAPEVFLQLATGITGTVTCFLWVTSITTTGFTLNINRSSTTPTNVLWRADLTT